MTALSSPPAALTLIPENSLTQAADRGLALSLNLFLFALPLAYITAVREITLGLAAFFWVAAMVLHRRLLLIRTLLDLPLLGLLVVAGLSLIWAVDPVYTFKEIRGELVKGFLVFYLAVYSVSSEERLLQTWWVLVLGNLLLAGYALWDFQYLGGAFSHYYIRARSLHSGYGSFGTTLITVWPYLLVLAVLPLGRWLRVGVWTLVLGNLFCLYITFGRAMWLAAAVETALVALLLRKRKALMILLLLGAVAVLAMPRTVWFHGERLPQEIGGDSQSVGGTAGDLIDIWKLAVQHIKQQPWQGIGFGRHSFSEAFVDFRSQHQPLLWHAHNTLLNLTFQTGLQGLLAVLAVIGVILFHTLRPPPREGLQASDLFTLATGVMVVGFFVRNFFDDFFVDDNALMFWLLVGAAFGIRGGRKSKIKRRMSNSEKRTL